MSSAAARLKAAQKAAQKKLSALDHRINRVRDERLLFALTNPIALEQRELELERKAVREEISDLAQQLGITVFSCQQPSRYR